MASRLQGADIEGLKKHIDTQGSYILANRPKTMSDPCLCVVSEVPRHLVGLYAYRKRQGCVPSRLKNALL